MGAADSKAFSALQVALESHHTRGRTPLRTPSDPVHPARRPLSKPCLDALQRCVDGLARVRRHPRRVPAQSGVKGEHVSSATTTRETREMATSMAEKMILPTERCLQFNALQLK